MTGDSADFEIPARQTFSVGRSRAARAGGSARSRLSAQTPDITLPDTRSAQVLEPLTAALD
jgi:hypothetical protein